jgi:hypothetical protein
LCFNKTKGDISKEGLGGASKLWNLTRTRIYARE